LVGLWFNYLIKFFEKTRNYREYNSPHNTSFFILSVIFIGLFYLYTGYYSELFNQNLIDESISGIFLTPWISIFSLPFLVYGLYSIYSCIKKYEVVYLYKQRSVNADKFAIGLSIFIFICNITFLVLILNQQPILNFDPVYHYPDLVFVFFTLLILILSVYGGISKEPSISELTPEMIANRRDRVRRIESTATRSIQSTPSRSTQKRYIEPRKRSRTQKTTRKPQTKKKKTSRSKLSKSEIIKRIKAMKPKAGILNIEDFKCIFCFNLPQYPQDKGRGIVLCPNCNHPAHADEFKDWLKSSNLCSRCDAEIPYSFRKNPKIISVKLYTKAIEYFKKKENL